MATMAITQTARPHPVLDRPDRRDLWCSGCGYGVVATLVIRCPMCGGSEWQETPLRRHRSV